MDKVVIFGAGEWGEYARLTYEMRCTIECFVDNDRSLWGKKKDGYDILPPEVLKEELHDVIVVIANAKHCDDIRDQVTGEYGIHKVVEFKIDISEKPIYYASEYQSYGRDDEIIISFMGGLGNQMFQYAMYRYLKNMGKKVSVDFSFFSIPGVDYHETMIWDVFKAIDIGFTNPQKKEEYLKDGLEIWENHDEYGEVSFIETVAEHDAGIWHGYFQVADVAESIRGILLRDFVFPIDQELENYSFGENKITVSVHMSDAEFEITTTSHIDFEDG